MPVRTRAAATAAAVLAWLLLSACSHPASPAPERVTMAYCGSGPQARPQVLEIDFSHFIAAPDRPSPPANQVVSLTC